MCTVRVTSTSVAGDDVIVTKAGTCTHGLDRFFASLYGKPVPGLAFFTLSLVSVQARRAFPLRVEQVVRSDAEKAASKATAAAKKSKAPGAQRRPGRPKGSKNKPKADGPCTPELRLSKKGFSRGARYSLRAVVALSPVCLPRPGVGSSSALKVRRSSWTSLFG